MWVGTPTKDALISRIRIGGIVVHDGDVDSIARVRWWFRADNVDSMEDSLNIDIRRYLIF